MLFLSFLFVYIIVLSQTHSFGLDNIIPAIVCRRFVTLDRHRLYRECPYATVGQ